MVRTYLQIEADDGSQEPVIEEEEEVEGDQEALGLFSVYVSTTRAAIAMGAAPCDSRIIVDAAAVDAGSSVISSIGVNLVTGLRATCVKPTKLIPCTRILYGSDGPAKVIGTIKFWFYFGGKMYTVMVHVIPGDTPLIFSHRDLDEMGFNYQSKYKIIERPTDGHYEAVEMRRGLHHLVFSRAGFFGEAHLRTMHRNLGHPTLEKQMKVLENANVSDVDGKIQAVLKEIIEHWRRANSRERNLTVLCSP